MDAEVLIRVAGEDDIDIIKSLAEHIWPATYERMLSPEQIRYMMDLFYSDKSLREQMERHTFLVAEIETAPVGFASYSSTLEKGVDKLQKIYIDPGLQGKGIGKAMIAFIVDRQKALGSRALHLNVNRNNKARLFYEKLGFKIIREEDIDIGGNYWMNDYVMRLEF
jgi:GNAT superfamily N-acetyltransferase